MDINLLPARVADLALQCEKTAIPKFLGFLTPSEAALASDVLKHHYRHTFFGGYDGAERTILAFLPDWCEEPLFPITAITFTYRKCDRLSHRDFLGALMALGINRETVGDILIEDGRAVVFVLDDILNFLTAQIIKIGSVGVTLQQGYTVPLPSISKVESHFDTVASLRIDCVVAAMCGFSRNDAAEAIADGRVCVNSLVASKTTLVVKDGDVITVRKKGRYKLTACDERSKKGRIVLKYDKYI